MPKMDSHTFLVEVGVEEIPSRYLEGLGRDFLAGMQAGLMEARLSFDESKVRYTPRRLVFEAVVSDMQNTEVEMVRGPAVSIAWVDNVPTAALEGFMRRVGLAADKLGRQIIGGREYVTAAIEKPVQSADQILPGVIASVLAALPQPRSMRWSAGDVRFIRPVRWILALLDDEVLDGEALGVAFGDITYGNRTDHPQSLRVRSVSEYWQALDRGRVMADVRQRRARIEEQARVLVEGPGGLVDLDPELLGEVANLVEWPTPFLGDFAPEFLEIPEPILVTSMRVHQRYFPVRGPDGQLMPHFVAVRNGIGEELDGVRRGNQKVLRARLSDARYFFDTDRKRRLADHISGLSGVTLHAKLGTYQDKVDRVARLFRHTREWWPLDDGQSELLERALALYKCDLLTQVVGEFPELQGQMGGIYAQQDGEAVGVAHAIRDQYQPASAKDRIPDEVVAQVLGLLDRIDTLMVFFHAGLRPTGSEDPFGLRRAALGVARLAVETPVLGQHTLPELLAQAAEVANTTESIGEEVFTLVRGRLLSQWEERWPRPLLQSILAREFPWQWLADRLDFLSSHRQEWDEVANACKRVGRIIRDVPISTGMMVAPEGIESQLAMVLKDAESIPEGKLEDWWDAVSRVVPVVVRFFDEVLVMDPDPAVRNRRLGLLKRVYGVIGRYVEWELL